MLAACGGEGGGSSPSSSASNLGGVADGTTNAPDMKTGVFSDSLVQGLNYSQGNITGTTNANGEFTCDANRSQPVVFNFDYAVGSGCSKWECGLQSRYQCYAITHGVGCRQ